MILTTMSHATEFEYRAAERNETVEITQKAAELLAIQMQIKIFHWSAKKYGKHKALDDLYTKFGVHLDTFVEQFMGLHEVTLQDFEVAIDFKTDPERVHGFLHDAILKVHSYMDVDTDTALVPAIQDIEQDLEQSKYLYRLE